MKRGLINNNQQYNLGLLFNNGYNIKYLQHCYLEYIDVETLDPLPKKIQEYNEKIKKNNFIIKYSKLGGIIDVRPIDNTQQIIFENVDTLYGIQEYNLENIPNNISNNKKCLYYGFNKAIIYIYEISKTIKKTINIGLININKGFANNNNNSIWGTYLSGEIPPKPWNKEVILICTRTKCGYGHYTLLIFDKNEIYYWDPQGFGKHAIDNILFLKHKYGIKEIKNIYTLNPKCYKKLKYQSATSVFCSIWTAYLIFLIYLNPHKELIVIMDYFGYKANTKKYLEEKINFFAKFLLIGHITFNEYIIKNLINNPHNYNKYVNIGLSDPHNFISTNNYIKNMNNNQIAEYLGINKLDVKNIKLEIKKISEKLKKK
jgi:hypothetical protein